MKKLILIGFLLIGFSVNSFAQIKCCVYFDGFWSSWSNAPSELEIHGDYDGFIIYRESEGPWDYRFKFTIHNFKVPDKKQRKKDIKTNKFYEFSGTVEYYTTDVFPSALAAFRKNKGPYLLPSKQNNGRPARKITSRATIKIAPFKDYPKTYNIWYDNVALGIDLGTCHFPIKSFK